MKHPFVIPIFLSLVLGSGPLVIVIVYLYVMTQPNNSQCQRTSGYLNLGSNGDEVGSLDPHVPILPSRTAYVHQALAKSALWSINLVFGNYMLSSVKLIDATWDIVIGRGGQALLAFLWYRVASDLIVTIAEKTPLPHELYTAVTISGSNMWTLTYGLHLLFNHRGPKRALLMTCLLLATLWVLAWPTVMSLLTGYVSLTEPYLISVDGSLVKYAAFLANRKDGLVVEDWGRVRPGNHDSGKRIPYTVLSVDWRILYTALDYCEMLLRFCES